MNSTSCDIYLLGKVWLPKHVQRILFAVDAGHVEYEGGKRSRGRAMGFTP